MLSTDPVDWSIAETQIAYARGTATPSDVIEALIVRIDRIDPLLNCFVTIDRDGARAAAIQAAAALRSGSAAGPLVGIAVAIKDVIDVAGMPTTAHSALRMDHVATRDAAVVARLRAAGAIILGKLATHEFAIGGPAFDLPYPPARNPWNVDHHPGGSSSGAGAGLAARMFAGAIGTDTAGSIRNPASACGVVGLKPTFDLVPRDGVFPLAWSLDHVGPLARTVADAGLLLDAIAGRDAVGMRRPYGHRIGRPLAGVRIGYVRHFHTIDMPATAETGVALDAAAMALAEAGADVREITLPSLNRFANVNRILLQSEGYAIHAKDMGERPLAFSAATRRALLPGAFLTATDLTAAMRDRRKLIEAVDTAFETVDILLTASSMMPPCRIDDPAEIARTYMAQARTPFNLTGHPALAMPAALSSDGLPLSLQFVGRRFGESRLLHAAAAWERMMTLPPPPSATDGAGRLTH